MNRITKEPAKRRQEIIDTAIKLFYQKGYEKTSISDIAREIGVAQGLCYRYFSSKEQIFDTAVEEYATLQVDAMCKSMTARSLSLAELIVTMPTFLDIETNDTPYFSLFHKPGSEKMHEQLSTKICEKLVPVVEQLTKQAIEREEIRPVPVKAFSSFCVYGQLGILMDQSIPGEYRVKQIKEFLLYLLEQIK